MFTWQVKHLPITRKKISRPSRITQLPDILARKEITLQWKVIQSVSKKKNQPATKITDVAPVI